MITMMSSSSSSSSITYKRQQLSQNDKPLQTDPVTQPSAQADAAHYSDLTAIPFAASNAPLLLLQNGVNWTPWFLIFSTTLHSELHPVYPICTTACNYRGIKWGWKGRRCIWWYYATKYENCDTVSTQNSHPNFAEAGGSSLLVVNEPEDKPPIPPSVSLSLWSRQKPDHRELGFAPGY